MSAAYETEVVPHSHVVAAQKLNRGYSDLRGPTKKIQIIKLLTVISVIFGIASVISSSFGFYYDFIQVLGDYTIPVAITLGVTIEVMKLASMWGAFAWEDSLPIKITFWLLLFTFTFLALVLHFRGLQNYETVTIKETIAEVRADSLALTKQREARADKLADLNIKTVNKVLNNGTAYDDKFVVKSMAQNNKVIKNLREDGTISDVDLMYIEQQKKSAETMKGALGVVFPIIELLAVLGVFILFLKKYSVSEGTRDFVHTKEKLEEMEARNIQLATEMLSKRVAHSGVALNQMLKGSSNQQSISTDQDECEEEQKRPIQIGYTKTTKTEEKVLPVAEKEKAIDFSTYSKQEGELIKILWDNGNIKVGEYLIPRDIVIADSKEFDIPRAGSILSNLMGNLETHGMVERPNLAKGYKAKVSLKKELWTEKE